MTTIVTDAQVRQAVESALEPGGFFVAAGYRIRIAHLGRRPVTCDVFQGHWLDHTKTRQARELETWALWLETETGPGTRYLNSGTAFPGRLLPRDGLGSPSHTGEPVPVSGQPLIELHVDWPGRQIHVTRNLLVLAPEAYEAELNVVAVREAASWRTELVGSVDLAQVRGPDALRAVLVDCVFRAVVGTSRLAITSPESPLPAFSLGWLAHFGRAPCLCNGTGEQRLQACAMTGLEELLERGQAGSLPSEAGARVLETMLRTVPTEAIELVAAGFFERWTAGGRAASQIPALLDNLFHHISLAPYTAFVDNLVRLLMWLRAPERLGPAAVIDVVGRLLRRLVRHLTAFDLVTFHNRGANYPDALFLDALLRAYVELANEHRWAFEDGPADTAFEQDAKRIRRRGLRQAWLVRKRYEGHRVPDRPSSPGENRRVLPLPYEPVPEEQLGSPAFRRRKLFEADPIDGWLEPTARAVLERSLADLEERIELQELGMALFLDRPLGVLKGPAEVDRTPLLSYPAFSRDIAAGRLMLLRSWGAIDAKRQDECDLRLAELAQAGWRLPQTATGGRPGVVALEDAARVSPDFRFLRTTRSSLHELLGQYDLEPLMRRLPRLGQWLLGAGPVLLVRSTPLGDRPILTAFDERTQPRLELAPATDAAGNVRYVLHGASELAEGGLVVLRAWDGADELDLGPQELRLRPACLE